MFARQMSENVARV